MRRLNSPGALDGVLPRHRVRDVEQVRRVDGGADGLKLVHQLVVDVQAPRRVHDHHVEAQGARLADRLRRPPHGVHLPRRVEHAQAGLLAEHGQLPDGRGAAHVGGHHQRVSALPRQPRAQLPRRRRLARTLQPEEQHDARRPRRRGEAAGGVAEQREHLVPDDPHDLLRGREAAQHVLAHGAVAHAVHERLHDLEVDVGLEQRQPDLAQGGFDRGLGQARLSPKGAEHILEARAQGVEHDERSPLPAGSCRARGPRALTPCRANPYRTLPLPKLSIAHLPAPALPHGPCPAQPPARRMRGAGRSRRDARGAADGAMG